MIERRMFALIIALVFLMILVAGCTKQKKKEEDAGKNQLGVVPLTMGRALRMFPTIPDIMST